MGSYCQCMSSRPVGNSRNFGDRNGPSVVLAPKGRRARFERRPIVAIVSLGVVEGNMFGGTYRHPELDLRTLGSNGETSFSGPRVTIRFQTHVVGSCGHGELDRRGPSGFLAAACGPWVGSYAAQLRAPYEGKWDARELTRMLSLVDRAREAGPRVTRGCELLRLIIGLQRCGVEVRVWSKTLDEKRVARCSFGRAESERAAA